jgi:methionyl-tRNA synthetase
VWFDAPIGYVSNTRDWCEANGERFDDWWRGDAEVHHFIGKDITYFHTLFWPAMLKVAGLTLPTRVHVHGMLTVAGEKMSKSRGTLVAARAWLERLDPELLRYYYASKLGPRPDDIDLDVDDFVSKVNADVVGKVVNLASRTARFVADAGLSAAYPADGGLFDAAAREGNAIAEAYEARDSNRALRLVLALADRANEFVEKAEPWRLKKEPGRERDVQDACTVALNLFRQVVVYLAPVMPALAEKAGALLGAPITTWSDAARPLTGTRVAAFRPLATRVEAAQVRALFPPAPTA